MVPQVRAAVGNGGGLAAVCAAQARAWPLRAQHAARRPHHAGTRRLVPLVLAASAGGGHGGGTRRGACRGQGRRAAAASQHGNRSRGAWDRWEHQQRCADLKREPGASQLRSCREGGGGLPNNWVIGRLPTTSPPLTLAPAGLCAHGAVRLLHRSLLQLPHW